MMPKNARVMTAVISFGLVCSILPSAAASPVVSYTNSAIVSAENENVPALKTLWKTQMDSSPAEGVIRSAARTSGGLVFFPKGGKLYAAAASTGRTRWTANVKPASPVMLSQNTLYVVDAAGMLRALNMQTGRQLWQTQTGFKPQTSTITSSLSAGILYVGGPLALKAYDPATGRQLWKTSTESEYGGPTSYGVYDGILVVSSVVSGALTFDQYKAYNPKTGRNLWTLNSSHGPVLEFRHGLLYLRNTAQWASPNHAAKLDQVEIKTGRIKTSYDYVQVVDGLYQSAEQLVVEGDYVYVAMEKYTAGVLEGIAPVLYRFDLNQDPNKQKPVVYEGYGKFLAGPYKNRLFFQDGLSLNSLLPGQKETTTYKLAGNPLARLDLHEAGLYAGLSDGKFYLIDLASGQTSGVVDTGSRTYGETLLVGRTVLIQTEKELIAVKHP
ncbi:PQQ-binding-like beta-propeller repeat protein [Saccharibacillus qingshengii]|uniref:outer membrane protein assembly factor BamB family protein n=1 Tax=Saccharibacillus qingshengii TaxID=1763540 RepID=UPI0015551F1F|nr:PQQ-binding-like beta-propeller repeat protein [Saccharibacillus qingshengii]